MTELQSQFFNFGDNRLDKRAEKCLRTLQNSNCSDGFPRIFNNQYELKSFYRLMNNEKVTPAKFVAGYGLGLKTILSEQAPAESEKPRVYYQYQDTTYGSYLSRNKLDLGYLENRTDNGLVVHTAILTDTFFTPLGIPWQRQIIRDRKDYQKAHDRKKRPFEEKESYKWVEAMAWSKEVEKELNVKIIHITDREGDIKELFDYACSADLDFIVRARHDRILPEEEEKLWSYVRSQPAKSKIKRQLLDSKGKTYSANCAIFWDVIELKDVENPVRVIYLRQLDNLAKAQATEWVIFTTLPIRYKKDAVKILDIYTHRWRTCEDFHKCLKSGCSMEKRQFDSTHALTNAIAMLSPIALHLLRMRHLAILEDQPVSEVLQPQEVKLAQVLADKYLQPIDLKLCTTKTVLWLVLLLGRMGGHQGIRQKGLPGWKTLWLGWIDFKKLMDGIILSKNFFTPNKCG